ncbi:sigma-54-dependent transcriptional regulator [Dehalobacterium formicoaceticum]|uniref:sigma-54-dependent transcriptional regulator n=1 Tax=Dehalobacterium formicoaceticum TaxID=51515 RepID=UPI000B7E2181|nr:sigma-54 dependent transcriptional regulator [Dehalobacterium formicoaceticum]
MEQPKILVIDDEVEVCTFFSFYFQEEKGLTVQVAYSGKDARTCFSNNSYDLALVDLKLPDDDGISLLKAIKASNPHCRVIIMTGYSTIKSAVEAIKYGADDYIDKPFDDLNQLDEILDQVLQEIRDAKPYFTPELDTDALNYGIVLAKNSPLKQVLTLGKKIANKKIPILIEGETGTGKELLARFIHGHSHRANQPFIPVNCGALTESLLESELFGYEKGAFTGASGTRKGFFEIAHNSTLFLDEINSASPAIQLKLLRVLETGEFFRVGGETPVKTDVRIIAASNQNLRQAVQGGDFREDLFYRLDVVKLLLPPLKERKADLPLLIQYFIDKNKPEKGEGSLISFTPKAIEALMNYSWPGNVRELSNIIIRALTLCEEKEIPVHVLPKHILDTSVPMALFEEQSIDWASWRKNQLHFIMSQDSIQFMDILEKWEHEKCLFLQSLIMEVLKKTENDQKEAARLLGITPRTLRYWKNEQN